MARIKKYWKIIALILGTIALSISLYFIMKACGITDIEKLRAFISGAGVWAWFIFIIIRVILTIFLCFVPSVSMIFDLLSMALFGANVTAFIVNIISITTCSLIMYVLGRKGASRLIEKLIGKEDLEKASKLINEKGIVFYPLMMAVGGFPDDGLVCVAGVTKMNFLYWLVSTVVGRSIGCSTTVFGLSLIPFSEFTTFYDWFVFGCCIIVLGFVAIKGGNWLTNKINNYRKEN